MKNKNAKKQILALTEASVMVALSVIFCRFVGFSPENSAFRFELGFLPIAYIAYTLGPIYAGLGFFTADVIGSLFQGYAPNPWISVCQLASGVIMGFFFYKRKFSIANTVICFSVIAVIIEFLLKSPIFVFMYDWTWGFTLTTRAINAVINLAIRIGVYFTMTKLMEKPLNDLRSKLKRNDKAFNVKHDTQHKN